MKSDIHGEPLRNFQNNHADCTVKPFENLLFNTCFVLDDLLRPPISLCLLRNLNLKLISQVNLSWWKTRTLSSKELIRNVLYIYIYIYTFPPVFFPVSSELRSNMSFFKPPLPFNIIYLYTAIGLSPGGSGYFTCKKNMKSVTTKFKSGGLHEKHVVVTWNVGNRLSICFYRHRETEKNLCRGGRSQDLPSTDF